MSMSLLMRAMTAAAALAVVPAIVSAQAPQTKRCKDGSSSTRSTFACWGHGGVDATPAAEPTHVAPTRPHESQAVQAGAPRSKHTKSTVHKKSSKATAHHAKAEHHEARAAKKKQDEGHHSWLPWRHKKAADKNAKTKKHASTSKSR